MEEGLPDIFTNEDFNSNFGIVEDNIAKSTELLNDVGVTLKYISENSSLGISNLSYTRTRLSTS